MTLCNLIGQIVEFYHRMGFKKIMTVPGFFPLHRTFYGNCRFFGRASEMDAIGRSGIFCPEVTYPWGIKDPIRVIAWGMGLERLAMLKFKRDDIRDLYQSPVSWLPGGAILNADLRIEIRSIRETCRKETRFPRTSTRSFMDQFGCQ